MLKRINDALPELILGILIYEIVVEFTGIWFVKDKLGYSNGLLIGAATAIGMAIHMAVVLRDSMDMAESGRTRRIALQYVLRYLVVVAVFFATFVGICHPPKPEAASRVRIGLRIKHFTKQNSWV